MLSINLIFTILSNLFTGFWSFGDVAFYANKHYGDKDYTYLSQKNNIAYYKNIFRFNEDESFYLNFSPDIINSDQLFIKLYKEQNSLEFKRLNGVDLINQDLYKKFKKNEFSFIEVVYISTLDNRCSKFDNNTSIKRIDNNKYYNHNTDLKTLYDDFCNYSILFNNYYKSPDYNKSPDKKNNYRQFFNLNYILHNFLKIFNYLSTGLILVFLLYYLFRLKKVDK